MTEWRMWGLNPPKSVCKTNLSPCTTFPRSPVGFEPIPPLCRRRPHQEDQDHELMHSDSNRGGRALQARLACPWLASAEEGGVEPLPVTTASLSRGGGPHGPHLPERKVKESNPQAYTWHGFLDRLRTIPRHPPKLLPLDSNQDQRVQSPLCCRYTKEH